MTLHPISLPLLIGAVAVAIAGASLPVVAAIVVIATLNEVIAAFSLTRP